MRVLRPVSVVMWIPIEQGFEAPTCSILYIGLVRNNQFEERYDIPVLDLKYVCAKEQTGLSS